MDITMARVPGEYWVCQAGEVSEALIREVILGSPHFWSLSRTSTEVSVVSELSTHPSFEQSEGPWAAFRVVGKLDFSLTGVLSRLSGILADGGVSVFAVSTFDTDYFLVRTDYADAAVSLWSEGGVSMV